MIMTFTKGRGLAYTRLSDMPFGKLLTSPASDTQVFIRLPEDRVLVLYPSSPCSTRIESLRAFNGWCFELCPAGTKLEFVQ